MDEEGSLSTADLISTLMKQFVFYNAPKHVHQGSGGGKKGRPGKTGRIHKGGQRVRMWMAVPYSCQGGTCTCNVKK